MEYLLLVISQGRGGLFGLGLGASLLVRIMNLLFLPLNRVVESFRKILQIPNFSSPTQRRVGHGLLSLVAEER